MPPKKGKTGAHLSKLNKERARGDSKEARDWFNGGGEADDPDFVDSEAGGESDDDLRGCSSLRRASH